MATGQGYAGPGVTTVGGASTTRGDENFSEDVNLGVFVQNRFDVTDDLFVTAAVRMDGNSAFGDNYGFQVYPKVDFAYNVPQSFLPGLISNLKVRGAYGMAGKAPGAFDKFQTYYPTTVLDSKPGVAIASPGNPDIAPENKREIETGLDVGLWNNRVGLELTYYDARTVNALLYISKAPSNGIYGRAENCCEIMNRGVEVAAMNTLVDMPSFRWNMNLTYEWNENRITDLGPTAVDDSMALYEEQADGTYEHVGWRYAPYLSGWWEGEAIGDILYWGLAGYDAATNTHQRTDFFFSRARCARSTWARSTTASRSARTCASPSSCGPSWGRGSSTATAGTGCASWRTTSTCST